MKDSAVSVSLTLSETSFMVSLNKRSLRCLDVTNFPSLPAKGLSLTEKVISIVGIDIFANSIASIFSISHIVSPMDMSGIPENDIISPTLAFSIGSLFTPSNPYIFVTLALYCSFGLW